MKVKNSRLLLAAFSSIGMSALAFGQQGSPAPGAGNWNLDTSGTTEIMLNETPVQFLDAQPGMIDGQLMIPVRAFAEQTGAIVTWDNGAKSVQINLPSQETLTLTAFPNVASPNYGTPVPTGDSDAGQNNVGGPYEPSPDMLSSSQVVVIDGHAYMPLSQLATAFNGTGNWDQSDGTATIMVPSDNVTTPGSEDMPPASNPPDTSGSDNPTDTDSSGP